MESFINDGWKVYLVANWKNVNGYLAMDEGACKPCHDYQKIVLLQNLSSLHKSEAKINN